AAATHSSAADRDKPFLKRPNPQDGREESIAKRARTAAEVPDGVPGGVPAGAPAAAAFDPAPAYGVYFYDNDPYQGFHFGLVGNPAGPLGVVGPVDPA